MAADLGATPEEVWRVLPGDELVTRPTFNATRAITIVAPPEQIWPWLVQTGLTRAGWYSYGPLDNLGRPSVRRIIPELQHLAPGDIVPMSPDGKHGMAVRAVDPPTSMIWGTPGDTTWAWQLTANPDGSTRLITRVRSRYRWLSPSIAFSALVEFADVWMMRKCCSTYATEPKDQSRHRRNAVPRDGLARRCIHRDRASRVGCGVAMLR